MSAQPAETPGHVVLRVTFIAEPDGSVATEIAGDKRLSKSTAAGLLRQLADAMDDPSQGVLLSNVTPPDVHGRG